MSMSLKQLRPDGPIFLQFDLAVMIQTILNIKVSSVVSSMTFQRYLVKKKTNHARLELLVNMVNKK